MTFIDRNAPRLKRTLTLPYWLTNPIDYLRMRAEGKRAATKLRKRFSPHWDRTPRMALRFHHCGHVELLDPQHKPTTPVHTNPSLFKPLYEDS